jgi:thiol-disulfide isomerase/thioredoxin
VDLRNSPIVVVLFTLEGCPACEEYKPRFAKIAKTYQGHVPVVFADANDPKFQDLAERLNVEAVPATFMLRRPRGMIRMVGSVSDQQVHWLLGTAARAAQTH